MLVASVMPQELTRDEWKVLRAIEAASTRYGDPTLNEIARTMVPPASAPGVHRMLKRLILKGWVKQLPFRSRGIRLLYPVPEEEPHG